MPSVLVTRHRWARTSGSPWRASTGSGILLLCSRSCPKRTLVIAQAWLNPVIEDGYVMRLRYPKDQTASMEVPGRAVGSAPGKPARSFAQSGWRWQQTASVHLHACFFSTAAAAQEAACDERGDASLGRFEAPRGSTI